MLELLPSCSARVGAMKDWALVRHLGEGGVCFPLEWLIFPDTIVRAAWGSRSLI